MAIVVPSRFIATLQYNASLFQILLRNVTQEQATDKRDGGDGWTVLEVICHLRDYEIIFFDRARSMIEQDEPDAPSYDQEAMAIENNYAGQQFAEVISDFLVQRGKFLSWLNQRSEGDWVRACKHPSHGKMTLLDQIVQTSTHDVNHLEQMMRILNS